MPAVWRSKLGTGVIVTGDCKGYSTKNTGDNCTMELAIPWNTILVDTDTITTSDFKIRESALLGLMLVYADVGGTASYVKTDGKGWNGSDIGAVALELKAPAAAAADTEITAAAPTSDLINAMFAVFFASIGSLYIARKKRR